MSTLEESVAAPADAEWREWVRKPGQTERDPYASARRRRMIDVGLGVAVPVVLIVGWQLASRGDWLNPNFYPSPTDIFATGREQWASGVIQSAVLASTRRVLLGFTVGAAGGFLLGYAMGVIPRVRAALEPMLNGLYTVPKLALMPIFLTLFGLGEPPIVVLVAVTVFFFVWISTMAAVVAVPEGYCEVAKVLKVSRARTFFHVQLPASLPEIFVGLRIACGVAVLVLVAVELAFSNEGVGYLIERGRTLFLMQLSYLGIVMSALMGVIFTALISLLGRLLTPWADQRNVVKQM